MAKKNPFANEKGEAYEGKEKEFTIWNEKQIQKQSEFIKELELHIKGCNDAIDYSISRFDILIISLSSGALGFSISFIKDTAYKDTYTHVYSLKIAWILFGTSLILNLLSQVTSFYANKFEIKISKSLIKKENGKEISANHNRLESIKCTFDNSTKGLNAASLLSFIFGIIFLIIFTLYNF